MDRQGPLLQTHTHRAMHKNIFKGTRHFVSVDRFETHAEFLYKSIVTNTMVLSVFRHHTCFYRSRRLLSIFSKGITSALPKQSSKGKLCPTMHRLCYTHRLCCATNTLCFPQILCVCHTPLFPIEAPQWFSLNQPTPPHLELCASPCYFQAPPRRIGSVFWLPAKGSSTHLEGTTLLKQTLISKL